MSHLDKLMKHDIIKAQGGVKVYTFENIDFEKYVNILYRAVSRCDTQSRHAFFMCSCKLLQRLFHIEYQLEFGSFDSQLDPYSKGKFFSNKDNSKDGCKILISDKLLKTDKTAEMDGCADFITKVLEENNNWKIPLTILSSLCHEFKHAYDYFNDRLIKTDLSKLKDLSDAGVTAVYFLSPAEIAARKVEIELPKEILTRLLPFCKNELYYSLSVYIEENMFPALNKKLVAFKKTEQDMMMVLEDSNIKIKDYMLLPPNNTTTSSITQEKMSY